MSGPRLIHLNGMPRVGKSTLARRWADDHPGTLLLDIDLLADLIGGWQRDFSAHFGIARGHALALATRHLADGRDVVLPQLVTSHEQGPRFELAADEAGAAYVEVALLVDDGEQRRRLEAKQPATDVEERIQQLLEDPADDLVGRIRGHLEDYLADRPDARRLDTTGQDPDATYAALRDLLDD